MKKTDQKKVRTKEIHTFVNEDEYNRIRQKMTAAGVLNLSAYVRKMAMDGYVVNMDLSDLNEIVRLLRICSNNLNQYAKVANESGRVYPGDIEHLQKSLDGLWDETRKIMRKISEIR